MRGASAEPVLPTLATAPAGNAQKVLAALVSVVFCAGSFALLPIANRPMPPMPGFIPTYQSALILVYGLTAYLLFTQYRRTHSASLLVLGAGRVVSLMVV